MDVCQSEQKCRCRCNEEKPILRIANDSSDQPKTEGLVAEQFSLLPLNYMNSTTILSIPDL